MSVDPVEPNEPSPPVGGLETSAVRRAILRALLSGIAGSIACMGIAALMGFRWDVISNTAFQGFLGGLVLGAVALFESVAWPVGTPTRRRLVLTCSAVWVLASLLCLGALLESVYARGFLHDFDSAYARERLGRLVEEIGLEPALFAGIFGALGLPFALSALARGCALRVPEQIAVTTLGAALPAAALLLGTPLAPRNDSRFSFGIVLAAGVFLPLAAWLGDLAERRRWGTARVERDRQRGLAWAAAAVVIVFASPLGYGFGTAVEAAREARHLAQQVLDEEIGELAADGDYAGVVARCERALDEGVLDRGAWGIGWQWEEAAWISGGQGPPHWLVTGASVAAQFDGDPNMREMRARYRLETGDVDGALIDLGVLVNRWGHSGDVHVLRVEAHLSRGDTAAAAADLALAERDAKAQRAKLPELRARLEAARRGE